MTKIKICGLSRPADIECANKTCPDLIGFVFWKKSRRYIDPSYAKELKAMLDPSIGAVGVFVDEEADAAASLLNDGIIDAAQLHGSEDDDYIARLRLLASGKKIIKAFRVSGEEDVKKACASSADMILLDAGMGDGVLFDWSIVKDAARPYFLAGGLSCENVSGAIQELSPYGVDVSSGVETDGFKDQAKIEEFVKRVREYESK